MKLQNLLVCTLTGYLLLGTSGAAIAQPNNTCPFGAVLGEVVLGNLTVAGSDCLVQGAIITGRVTVTNNIGDVFVLRDVVVNGRVKVTGGSAVITRTVVVGSNLVVEDTVETVVNDTLVQAGNMRFKGNDQVLIYSNVLDTGNIRCANNTEEYAVQNVVPIGVVNCFGQ